MYPSGVTAVDKSSWLPIPGCEFVDAVDLVISNVGQDPGEPSFRIDAAHAGRLDEDRGSGKK